MKDPLALALVKGIREPHEAKKNSFDLGGNRTHDLQIRSTVTLPTELRGRTPFTRANAQWVFHGFHIALKFTLQS